MMYGASISDSFGLNSGNSLVPDQFYPHQAQKLLADLRIRNFGVSGNTTAQMVGRMTALTHYEVPEFVVIYGGANDGLAANQSTVQASPSPTSTVFAVGSGKAATMAAPGSWLTVNGQDRQVLSISGDTITLVSALSGAPSSGDAVAIATTKNLIQLGQFARNNGCANVMFGLQHFLNWSSGGDTLASPSSAMVARRALQQAAADALSAPVVDFYTGMRNRIVAATDAEGYVATTVATAALPNVFTVASATGLAVGKKISVDTQLATIIDVSGKLITTSGMKVIAGVSSTVSTNYHVADADPHLSAYGGYVMGGILADALIAEGWATAA